MKLFLVGKDGKYPDDDWIPAGIFDEFSKALAACKTEDYFIVPIELNAVQEVDIFSICFFPRAGTEITNPIPEWGVNLREGGLL